MNAQKSQAKQQLIEGVCAPQDMLAPIVPYDPKYLPARVYLSANENPETLPGPVVAQITQDLADFAFNRYPDPLANELRTTIAQANGLESNQVLLGNAGDELLFDIALAWGGAGRTMINVPPTFSVYVANAHLTGTNVVDVPRTPSFDIDEQALMRAVDEASPQLIVITSPNNPTGNIVRREFLEELLDATDALVLLDEAYIEFAGEGAQALIAKHPNLIILRTFSKAFSAAGVRLGYVLAQAPIITELIKVRQPYSVDAVSQAIGRAIMQYQDLFQLRIERIQQERERVFQALLAMEGVEVFPSAANFLLVKVPHAHRVWQALYDEGILIRDFSASAGLEDCLRITIGMPEENDEVLSALPRIIAKVQEENE